MIKHKIKERRRFIRAKRLLGIQFQLIKTRRKKGDYQSYLSTTHDMSAGGLTFYSPCEYAVGDLLQASVSMAGVLKVFDGQVKVTRTEWKKNARHYFVAVELVPQTRKALSHSSPRRQSLTRRTKIRRISS